jgi:hypothetical protein
VAGAVLMIAAFLALALGVIADLIRINRILIEDTLEQQRRAVFARPPAATHNGPDPASWPLPARSGRA